MWFSRAGRIAAWIALGVALAGCGEQRLDVCKAARGGGAPHSVELVQTTFTEPARPLPVITIAANGIYLDARPLLASWPRARCEKLARKIAPRDRSSLAEEQLIFGLRDFAPASAEAERLGMLRLRKALYWTLDTLHAGAVNLRVDKRAPCGWVQRLLSPMLRGVDPWFIVANGRRELALARGWKPSVAAFGGSCHGGLSHVVEVHKRGFGITECDWPEPGPHGFCGCALAADAGATDKVLLGILRLSAFQSRARRGRFGSLGSTPMAPIPKACRAAWPQVWVAASPDAPWSRWVAMFARLHRIGAPTFSVYPGTVSQRDCAIVLTPSGARLPSAPAMDPPWCAFIDSSALHPRGIVCPNTDFEDRIDEIGGIVTR